MKPVRFGRANSSSVWLVWIPLFILFQSSLARAEDVPRFNYAEALQKSLYFYEAQQSGVLSPNNRVGWRGNAFLKDGQDIGRDLSGGWFDAGDHWTANLTMSFAAMTLAWSAVEHPEAYLEQGQMDELLENLVHVNRYFLRCVLNPSCPSPSTDLEVAIGCGGREGVEPPRVHDIWASAEIAEGMTHRPTFRLNRTVPGGDVPAAIAAAMAASAMVIRDHGTVLRHKRGFTDFDASAFSIELLGQAAKLTQFARANSGPAITDALPQADRDRVRKARSMALRSDGRIVETGYRADPFDKIVAAASWLARAHQGRDASKAATWQRIAIEVYENEYKAESNHDWWKDFGAGNFGKLAAFNLMRLAPQDERLHAELQLFCSRFAEYRTTPGGLRLREWDAHEYGSLRHANNAAVIALYYSNHVEKAPPISGNTWWKAGRSNAQLRDQYRIAARSQVDYALGANPYGRSFLVGFGHRPFNHVHHRGAYGPWAGFEHFIPGKADDRGTNRHILYGALVAGPDHNDVFIGGAAHLKWQTLPNGKDQGFFYRFPNRQGPIPKEGYRWDPQDEPFQDVMDSTFNEVALDYNAGITASFAWLVAHGLSTGRALPDATFPPPEVRNESRDLHFTDREFFVSVHTTRIEEHAAEIEVTIHNRSRWPARVVTNLSFRLPIDTRDREAIHEVKAAILEGQAQLAPLSGRSNPRTHSVLLPRVSLSPGTLGAGLHRVRLRLESPSSLKQALPWLPEASQGPRLIPEIEVYEDSRRLGGDDGMKAKHGSRSE